MSLQYTIAQNVSVDQEIKQLSMQKWQWMADKNIEQLEQLFHDQSKFVHMSGTWNKDRELEIIESGSIWYKKADVHGVEVEVFDDTAILWNRITLTAHVRGNDVSNEFTVTEIYKKIGGSWKMLDLTFSKARDTHKIQPATSAESKLLQLSKDKWQWMADKDVDKLDGLFHDQSNFVHMGGSWGKQKELEVIESGRIHYKQADILEASVEVIDDTAILLNRITLLAVVGGKEVTNPFMVTEVYKKNKDGWQLGSMSFTKLLQ
jgi:hypothetical protein